MKLVEKKTGRIVDIPDDQVQAAYLSGQYGIPKGAPMPVKVPGLPAGVVDPADAAAALEQGASVATEQQYRAAQQEARYGGVGGAVAAGAVGAARGLAGAFGVPFDAVAIGLAESGARIAEGRHEVDPYRGERYISPADALRERLRGYNEQHPLASTIGEIGGMVGATALGGGLMGRVGAAGEAAAGRFAAEGGLFGGLAAVNESALGDTELTANKVLAGIGHGAIIGGALGAGINLGAAAAAGLRDRFGRWIGTLRPKDIESIAERHFGYVPEGLGERIQKSYARTSSLISGKDEEAIAKFTALTPEGAEARRVAVFDAPAIQEEAERAVRRHIDDIMAAGDLVSAEARGGLKADYVRRSVARGNEAEVRAAIQQRLAAIEEGLEAQLAQEMAPSMMKSARTVRKLLERARAVVGGETMVPLDRIETRAIYSADRLSRIRQAMDQGIELPPVKLGLRPDGTWGIDDGIHRIAEARNRGLTHIRARITAGEADNAEAFIALDNLKRGLQRLTSSGYKSLRLIADPVDQLNARRTVAWLDGVAQDLRLALEDEALWGKAAVDQRTINAAWTRQIDASNRFHRALTTEVGRDPNNPYVQMRGADPAKVATYIRGLTNPHNDLTHHAVRDYVTSTRELADAIAKSYDLPPDKIAEVARVRAAAASFEKEIGKAEKSLVLANQYRALLEGPDPGSVAGAFGAVGAVAAGLPGGVLGSLAGAALNAMRAPGRVIAQMAAVEKIAAQTDSKIARAVRDFLSGRKGPPKPPASVEMLAGKGGERKAFEAKVKEVRRLAGNKEELLSRISELTRQFDGAAPNVATALTVAAIRGVEYLARHSPPGFAPRPEALAWGIEEPPLYTDAEMREWARRAAVVNDPLTAIESMRRGMLTPEEVDALKNVYPALYAELQREFVRQRIERPSSMNYAQMLQIELMFNVPLNRTLEPDFMRAVQQSFSVPDQPSPPPQRPVGDTQSKAMRTASQELQQTR